MIGFRVFTSQLEAVLKNHVFTEAVALFARFDAMAEVVAVNVGVAVSRMHPGN